MNLECLIAATRERRNAAHVKVEAGVARPHGTEEWKAWSESLGRWSELDRMVHLLERARIHERLQIADARADGRAQVRGTA